jgi:hypothetical protein
MRCGHDQNDSFLPFPIVAFEDGKLWKLDLRCLKARFHLHEFVMMRRDQRIEPSTAADITGHMDVLAESGVGSCLCSSLL